MGGRSNEEKKTLQRTQNWERKDVFFYMVCHATVCLLAVIGSVPSWYSARSQQKHS